MANTCEMRIDATEWRAAADEFTSSLERLGQFPELLAQFEQRLLGLTNVVTLERKPLSATSGAGEFTMCLKPSESFLELMSALRACEGP